MKYFWVVNGLNAVLSDQGSIGVDLRLENAWDDVITRILVKIVENCAKIT